MGDTVLERQLSVEAESRSSKTQRPKKLRSKDVAQDHASSELRGGNRPRRQHSPKVAKNSSRSPSSQKLTSPSSKHQRDFANEVANRLQPSQPVPCPETVSRARKKSQMARRLRSGSSVDANKSKPDSTPYEASDPLTMNKPKSSRAEYHQEPIDMNVFAVFAVSVVIGLPAITWMLFSLLTGF